MLMAKSDEPIKLYIQNNISDFQCVINFLEYYCNRITFSKPMVMQNNAKDDLDFLLSLKAIKASIDDCERKKSPEPNLKNSFDKISDEAMEQ